MEKMTFPKQYIIKKNSSISVISMASSALILNFSDLLLSKLYLKKKK